MELSDLESGVAPLILLLLSRQTTPGKERDGPAAGTWVSPGPGIKGCEGMMDEKKDKDRVPLPGSLAYCSLCEYWNEDICKCLSGPCPAFYDRDLAEVAL